MHGAGTRGPGRARSRMLGAGLLAAATLVGVLVACSPAGASAPHRPRRGVHRNRRF